MRSCVWMMTVVFSIGFCGCQDQASRPEVLVEKAYLHEERGEFNQAIEVISQVIAREPENPVLYYDRGVFYEQAKRFEEASADYEQALRLDSDLYQARNNLAVLKLNQGKLDEALLDLDILQKMDSDAAVTYFNRGRVYLAKGDLEKARREFDLAIEKDPRVGLAYFYRAHARESQNDLIGAFEDVVIAEFLNQNIDGLEILKTRLSETLSR